MRYLLGIDLGTSGTKTVLFDLTGNAIDSKTIEYPLYRQQMAGQSKIFLIGGMLPVKVSNMLLPKAELMRQKLPV